MSFERYRFEADTSENTDVPEAPMVHVDDEGVMHALNLLAEARVRELTAAEISFLQKAVRVASKENAAKIIATLATLGIGVGVYESLETASRAAFDPVPQHQTQVDKVPKTEVQVRALREAIEKVAPGSLAPTETSVRPLERPSEGEKLSADQQVTDWYERYVNEPSPLFDQYTQSVAAEKKLGRMQVLFMTQQGELLQGATNLTEAAGYTPREMTVSYKGGDAVGIPPAWSKPIRERLSKEHGIDDRDIEMRHVYKALKTTDPERVDSLLDLVTKRALSIAAVEGASIPELIETNFHFSPASLAEQPALRAYIEQRLKDVLPGQIAKESHFNINAVSSAGARGPLQIMPDTWKKYADPGMNIESLSDSLVVAGKYYAAAYEFLTKNLATEFAILTEKHFAEDEMAFVEHFLIPYLVNDYNAGDGNMKKVGEWFVAQYSEPQTLATEYKTDQPLQNKDVFFAFTELASVADTSSGYKVYAGDYVKEISGWNQAITSTVTIDLQYASNE